MTAGARERGLGAGAVAGRLFAIAQLHRPERLAQHDGDRDEREPSEGRCSPVGGAPSTHPRGKVRFHQWTPIARSQLRSSVPEARGPANGATWRLYPGASCRGAVAAAARRTSVGGSLLAALT